MNSPAAQPGPGLAPGNAFSQVIEEARRITVKIGSSLVAGVGSEVRDEWLATVAADLAHLRRQGKQIIVVSSGAVALGRQRIGIGNSARLDVKQAAAAAGQPLLMRAWDKAMSAHGISTAQLLLTLGDTEARRRWLNARSTIETLLSHRVLPVINENDSVATDELRYGDNDRLSARIAQMLQSDVLILLSDVDGLYTGDPARTAAARHIPYVAALTPDLEDYARDTRSGGVGTGGMRSKLAAARIARSFGCTTVIADGREVHPLTRLLTGARSTIIAPAGSPASAYKQWIAGTLAPAGALRIDAGAGEALKSGKSLLPAGVNQVEGTFERGVCLRILDELGMEIGRGISAYSSAEAISIIGRPSSEIPSVLGYQGPDELIHRNDLVLTCN